MSLESLRGAGRLRLLVPMARRDPSEPHRAATPLELFFDLCFVVAVAQAASGLHHDLNEGLIGSAILDYGLVFFGIWWAWMNFTWFASAYDTDDIGYRLSVFVMMTGALIMAAGIPSGFDDLDFSLVTLGYVVMRLALVPQWIRASRADSARRTTCLRYAIGVSLCQAGWIGAQFLPSNVWLVAFAVLATCELLVPVWAEAASPTPMASRAHLGALRTLHHPGPRRIRPRCISGDPIRSWRHRPHR